jgi:hypothetical protein
MEVRTQTAASKFPASNNCHQRIIRLIAVEMPAKASASSHPDTEDLKAFGERYSIATGVELKFDADDASEIDWNMKCGWNDVEALATRYV